MRSWIEQGWRWIEQNPGVVWGLSGLSIGLLLFAFVALPIVIAQLPADWLMPDRERVERHPVLHVTLTLVRNAVGWVLLVAGVAMLALPGQGLLTILAGLLLVDLPGKHRVIVRILRTRRIRRAVGWLRKKAGKPPLQLPDDDAR